MTTWPFRKRRLPSAGALSAIYIAAGAGQDMQSLPAVTAIAGAGLAGDRYSVNAGFWKVTDACQVTLITEHDLSRASARDAALRGPLFSGRHRRNLVIRGLTARQVSGRRLRIGTAEFEVLKPRPPCGYLDRVAGRGLYAALGANSGFCLRVLVSGELSVGDAVELCDARS